MDCLRLRFLYVLSLLFETTYLFGEWPYDSNYYSGWNVNECCIIFINAFKDKLITQAILLMKTGLLGDILMVSYFIIPLKKQFVILCYYLFTYVFSYKVIRW